jgi:voltage-gated potassium channel
MANILLGLLLGVGTIGYTVIEGWTPLDSLYMTFITLTTIGFAEVHSMSDAGRVFTIAIGIVGIGSVAFIATRSVQVLLTSQRLRLRQITKMIQKTSDHYIICGYGRIGSRIAQDLARVGVPFVVIERSSAKIERLEKEDLLYVEGDAEEEEILTASGIERAKGLILTLPEDSSNVFVTLVAREINPDLFILARTDKHQNQKKLLRSGADKVISPYEIGADRMAQVILKPQVDRFMERVLHTGALNLVMEEVPIEEGAPIAGKTLADSKFRQQFDAIVVSIIDGVTRNMLFNPESNVVMKAGDVLIVLGSGEMVERLRTGGCVAQK